MHAETRYVEPDASTVRAVAAAALVEAGDRCHIDAIEWVRTGSSTLVGLGSDTVVRIARSVSHAADLLRAQRLVDALPALPFEVPRSRTRPIAVNGVTGVGVCRLRGHARRSGPADPTVLRTRFESIHAIDPEPIRHLLAPARAFCGGDRWYDVLTEQAVPRLPPAVRTHACALVGALAGQAAPARVVNHGDLAGSNILWNGDQVAAVLDWGLTAYEDPAEDLASLAGWYGWHLATAIADAGMVARAQVFRGTFPLMILGFNLLHHRPEDEISRAVDRVVNHLNRS